MVRRMLVAAAVAVAAITLPAAALAGTLTLHPAGFGEHSYSAWKAHQGLPDSSGNDNQALYFQKNTFTETNAAGVAVFKGYEGLPGNELTGLSFWWRTDGHCGAGAPRFNVYVRPTGGGPTQTIFIGCQGMAPTGRTAPGPNGTLYQERAIAGPIAPAGTELVGLALVFDEGNASTVNPAYTSMCNGSTAGSCVYLDDIQISTSDPAYGVKCWTGANDNGNGSTGPCETPAGASAALVPTSLFGDIAGVPVDPTDTGLVSALNLVAPDVPLTSWALYPNVY